MQSENEEEKENYWENEPESGSDEVPKMYAPDATDDSEPELIQEPASDSGPKKPAASEVVVHWDATEIIDVQKNPLWYIAFAIVVIAFIAADLFFIKSYTFSALVIVMAVAAVIHSILPPKTIHYTLSGDQGLYVGEKLYHFSEFKSFGLIFDRGHHSIMLIPVKRFALDVSVYFPEEAGEKIVDIFGSRLPMQDVKLDAIDVIVRKLRL